VLFLTWKYKQPLQSYPRFPSTSVACDWAELKNGKPALLTVCLQCNRDTFQMQMAESIQNRDFNEPYQKHFVKVAKDAVSDQAFCFKSTVESGSFSKSMLSMREGC